MNNATNTTSLSRGWKDFLNRSTATIAVESGILLLIGVIAIGGNFLVLSSVYRNPNLRTVTNYFVLSLASADIVNSVIVLPFIIVWSIKSRFVFGKSVCDFQGIAVNALFYVSVFNMALMAVNRFFKVCNTYKYNKVFKKSISLMMISAVWVGSFAFVALYSKIVNFASVDFKPGQMRCGFIYKKLHDVLLKIIVNCVTAVSLIVPFNVIAFCYFKVFKKIRKHKKHIFPRETHELRGIQTMQETRCQHSTFSNLNVQCTSGRDTCVSARSASSLSTSVQEIKITWTLFAVLLGYCVSWIPVLIVLLASTLAGENYVPRSAQMVATFTGASSSVINPIIYGVMNPAFRREYKQIFSWKVST